MPSKKALVRSPWTREDVRALKAYSKARTPVAEVAKAMKRTERRCDKRQIRLASVLGTVANATESGVCPLSAKPNDSSGAGLISVRLDRSLGRARLAQGFDDAIHLGIEGRIVGQPVLQRLHREVGIDLQELRDRVFGLFVMTGPRVGGGERGKRVPVRRVVLGRHAAPFDRLFPLSQKAMTVAKMKLPLRHLVFVRT
jgi:hypothetical protein